MASSQVLASIRPGALIAGRYSVEHALGKGGMGSVYAVSDVSTGRRLALKCLQREAAAENGVAAALFQREYHTLAHLRHPRVIRVFDYGLDNGRPFYTMELLDGSDLRELAPLPFRRACQVLRDVASSLALLHSRRLLHRDVSPRNVRCTRDGQAKLLDFGTMAPMGIAKDAAGTPPYMAPEAVHGQPLDARTDLYALGALAYWTLTGYDAYPARDARDLRQLWPRPILPPSAMNAEIPEPLDALVMSLLSLDPQARPGHVAEVIERLTAIAGLPPAEHLEVARAYLTSPTLVGHADTMASFHKRLVRAARRRGSAIVIRAGAGLGRSRLLQALVLEAKLSGIQVLTADAEDARKGELGVMRALVTELCEAMPEQALAAFRAHAAVLGAMFPALYGQLDQPPPLEIAADRRAHVARVLQAIRAWLVAVAEHRTLMIAVDDADQADEWSGVGLTLLAGDANKAPLVVVAALEPDSAAGAYEVLCAEASAIDLAPLSEDDSLKLLRSVFGDVPHLHVVAEWIASLAQGNPRTTMELAQYLVDHNIALYARGSWTLPETLHDQALPQSIEQAIDDLLALLSPPARAVAEALALVTDHGHLQLGEIVRLYGGQSADQTYGAVDELIAAQVATASGPTFQLRQRGLLRALLRGMSEERQRLLHLRLATLYEELYAHELAGTTTPLLIAYHRYKGGDLAGCFDQLPDLRAASRTTFGQTTEAVAMYEACLAYGQEQGFAPLRLHPLLRVMLRLSSVTDPSLIRHAEPALAQLCRDSGRVYIDEFADDRDPLSRIRSCIRRARRAYEQTPEHERGLEPVEAIYELGAAAMTLIGTYVADLDHAALERLQVMIDPFRALSPVFDLLSELTRQACDSLLGRDVTARRIKTLERLELPLEGLDAGTQDAVRCRVLYWLAIEEASAGRDSALQYAGMLERLPLCAALSAQVRTIYHLFSGSESEADLHQRQRERLVLEARFTEITSIRGVFNEAFGYYLCGSVLGLGRTLASIRRIVARYPGWRPRMRELEGLHALLRGEPKVALSILDGSDAHAARIHALLALGQHDEARELADQIAAPAAPDREQPSQLLRLQVARALALNAAGEAEEAARVLSADIERAERSGVSGMLLCAMHEARARIAIDMDDRTAFRHHIKKLGATYGRGTSALRARYEQLGAAARLALMSVPPQPMSGSTENHGSEVRTLLDRAFTAQQRLRQVLELIADRADAKRAYLFGMQSGGLRLSAVLGDHPPPDGLDDMLAFYLSAELESSSSVSNAVTGTFSAGPDMVAWINDGQYLYYPVLLSCLVGQRRVVSGVAVLALPLQRAPRLPPELLSEISRALIESGDVSGADAAD